MKKLLGVLSGLVLVFSLAAIGLPSPGLAQAPSSDVVYVDTDNVAGPWDGTSWSTAYQTVQEGLDDAYLTGKEVWVAAGTYKPTSTTDRTVSFQLKSGVALYGGFNATETVGEQRDWATNVTILSGDIGTPGDSSDNSYHTVVGASNAILDGFTVTDGNANGTGNNVYGGGIYNDNASPTVTNCTFSNNSASGGGGMFNNDSAPTVTNCIFSGNLAGWGGAMYNAWSSPTVTECTFYSNSAINGAGGMYNHDYSSATVINCRFSENSAGWGGGMQNHESSAMVINCIFSGNSATAWGGGMNSEESSLTVTNCTFSSNSASIGGSGMSNGGSSPTVTNCILWDNGEEIANDATSTPLVAYCDVQGSSGSGVSWDGSLGTDGGGNIDAMPLFVDPAGDYHLQAGSPCIDKGSDVGAPTEDIEGNPRPIDGDGDSTPTTDMGAYEYVPAIEATMDFDPDTLNLKSKGKWVTAYIELPEGYDVNDIDASTVSLNDAISAEQKPITIGDYDSDGVPDLMVKFARSDVQDVLEPGDEVELTVSGELTNGTPFEGVDTSRVINQGKK